MAKGNSQKKSDGAAPVIRGIDVKLGSHNVGSFRQDLHTNLDAYFIVAKETVGEAIKQCRYTVSDHGKFGEQASSVLTQTKLSRCCMRLDEHNIYHS